MGVGMGEWWYGMGMGGGEVNIATHVVHLNGNGVCPGWVCRGMYI